uniref:Uncharacterized protein n=1 Tax=Anopheles darlingi TaxID=43151 RepID=A0A2M4D1J6_ANODA
MARARARSRLHRQMLCYFLFSPQLPVPVTTGGKPIANDLATVAPASDAVSCFFLFFVRFLLSSPFVVGWMLGWVICRKWLYRRLITTTGANRALVEATTLVVVDGDAGTASHWCATDDGCAADV